MKASMHVLGVLIICQLSITVYALGISTDALKKKRNQTQAQFNDMRYNKISKVRFPITNYGIFGLDVTRSQGGGFWPRGSDNEYIFGGGIWFGAVKSKGDTVRPLSVISYNPNSGSSWMTPGSIDDGEAADRSTTGIEKNRVYLSTDYVRSTGQPRNPNDNINWPIWDSNPTDTLANLSQNKQRTRYLGHYINDLNSRNRNVYPKGPAFISQEDVFTIFKDTDLQVYEMGEDLAKTLGYPLKIQVEQTVYSWGFGEYGNFLFLRYNIINRSTDTLYQCWMAPAFDFDLAAAPNFGTGAANDRVRYYDADTTLNLAIQWTNTDRGERGKKFGYIGMNFLESPAVDESFYIRRDKTYYHLNEQLGLKTFRNWIIQNDPNTDIERYNFMAAGVRDGDTGPGDKRFLMATGPYHMRPGDTARVVVGMIFALPIKDEADGTDEDLVNLVRRVRFAQRVYDNGFAAPQPPEPPQATFEPLNHAIKVKWDETSYNSIDREEKGMDLMGFRIYRCRVPTQDTFSVDFRSPSNDYPGGRGPFAWKQIAEWITPSPFWKTGILSDSTDINSARYPYIRVFPRAQKSSYRSLYPGFLSSSDVTNDSVILVRRIPNTSSAPWDNFWRPLVPQQTYSNPIRYDSLTIGIVRIITRGRIPTLPTATTDTATSNAAMYDLWQQLSAGTAQIRWFVDDWVDAPWGRQIVQKYLDSVTNNRSFLDLGDDNRDGVVSQDEDLRRREELLNNIDYFYKVIALDEGYYAPSTPVKSSIEVETVNLIQAFALGKGPHKQPDIEIMRYDTSALGGLYNFKLIPKDIERLAQLFAGHEIELEFQPDVRLLSGVYMCLDTLIGRPLNKAIYLNELIVRDKTTGEILATYQVFYEPADCLFTNFFSNVAMMYVSPSVARQIELCDALIHQNDSSLFVHPNNQSIVARGGTWNSDKSCNGATRAIRGTFALSFDYFIQQYGGIFRPHRIDRSSSQANTLVEFRLSPRGDVPQPEGIQANYDRGVYERYDNGSGLYEIEFLPGGVETISTTYTRSSGIGQRDTIRRTVDVSYLNVRVRNLRTYRRPSTLEDSIIVEYGGDLPHSSQRLPVGIRQQDGTVQEYPYPHPRVVPIGSYNLSAYGWFNGRYNPTNIGTKDSPVRRQDQAANSNSGAPVGTQGRYYLSTITPEGDTLDFTHVVLLDGIQWWLDFPGKGGRNNTRIIMRPPETMSASVDFKPGDKVHIETVGGPVGLPLPGAKVAFKISNVDISQEQLTDSDLDRVLIVPNPYVITHVGQKSSYDSKIYFTRLPKECTIKIYTIAGDHIRTIHHVDQDNSFRYGMDIWNLLSDNLQRAVSQGLIAVIETPNGAKTVKKFSVVVGGARILGR